MTQISNQPTITAFLLARIAEDEAEANWVEAEGDNGSSSIQHPARILAECAAKRAIVEQAGEVNALEGEFTDYMWRGAEPELNTPKLGDQILRTLATIYSDHPDYKPDWAL